MSTRTCWGSFDDDGLDDDDARVLACAEVQVRFVCRSYKQMHAISKFGVEHCPCWGSNDKEGIRGEARQTAKVRVGVPCVKPETLKRVEALT